MSAVCSTSRRGWPLERVLFALAGTVTLLSAALAAFTVGASAQDRRPEYGPAVNAAGAKKIAAGIIAECQKNSWNVAVAVVDTHGFLVYFERMDNTQTASMDIAIGKAKAAATYRRPTRVFMDVINKGGPATATLPGVFASPGGVPTRCFNTSP